MSTSFSDQPPQRDSRSESGYTPTPTPSPLTSEGDEPDTGVPKLGSLAQKARGKQLKQARVIFFIVGILTIGVNVLDIAQIRSQFKKGVEAEIQKRGGPGMVRIDSAMLQKEEDTAFLLGSLIDGLFILSGFLFIFLGLLVYRFPVPCTIFGLILYVIAFLSGLAITVAFGEGEAIARYAVGGVIVRILIIVGLISSIKSALAYERERRDEADFAPQN